MSNQTNISSYGILFCVLFLFVTPLLRAQNPPTVNSILEGTVADEITNQPLEGANIAIEGVTNQTTTNARGQFELRTGQKFPYNIIITLWVMKRKLF
ncbi:carboxypeptidase-like regulatory domain-containing protein [Niabella hibiscisoli]|uniref:carboxypeptidase-like regulatory domain-containing protein n=1 Tax=Niabella hibiscisoli TaxID=1825928 RepID=UPI001F1093D3|nr:carboxypeptidase-like regulatory domain-containing protein [Niabella hibiscisoli]MCH5718283.1 carboxypeptidase-like regulatory domain-containing protein [Niabella hibiscisoli]